MSNCQDLVDKPDGLNGSNGDVFDNGKDDPDSTYVFVSENEVAEVAKRNGKPDSTESGELGGDHGRVKGDVGELEVGEIRNEDGEVKGDPEKENLDNSVVQDESENVVVVESEPQAEDGLVAKDMGTLEESDVSVLDGEPALCGISGDGKEQNGVQSGESRESHVTDAELAQSEQQADDKADLLDTEGEQNDLKLDHVNGVQNEENAELGSLAVTSQDCQVVDAEADRNGLKLDHVMEVQNEENAKLGSLAITNQDFQIVDKDGNQNSKLDHADRVQDEEDTELGILAMDLKENKDSQAADDGGYSNGLELHQKKEVDQAPVESGKDDSLIKLEKEMETVPCSPTADANLEGERLQTRNFKEHVDDLPAANAENCTLDEIVTETNQDAPGAIKTLTCEEKVGSCPNGHAQETMESQSAPVENGNSTLVVPSGDTKVDPDNAHPANCTELEIESENGASLISMVQNSTDNDTKTESDSSMVQNSTDNDAKTESDSSSIAVVSPEEKSASADCIDENAGYVGDSTAFVENPVEETSARDSVEKNITSNACQVNLKTESKVETVEADGNIRLSVSGSPDLFVVSSERNLGDIQGDINVENGGKLLDINGNNDTYQQPESDDALHTDDPTTSSQEGSTVDVSEGQIADTELVRRPFYYMIRIPRYDDESLKARIDNAQLQVNEKTTRRDAIGSEIQAAKTICKEYRDIFDAAKAIEKSARDLLKSKRKEIDAVQSMMTRVKSAMSVEDIDARIRSMEHIMHHETLSLKEEKQFIRDIKQLKQMREQHSSTMGNQVEVQEAMVQKDEVEDRIKSLRKEADSLRENLLRAEVATKDAKKKYNEENEKLTELLTQFKAADTVRQEAYAHFQSLKKQSNEKNKNFWMYKDESKRAIGLAQKGEKEKLQQHCIEQVERVMRLWNNDYEFRKEYIRCNMRSTLKRLRTLDGRALGPDEESPVLSNSVNQRVAKDNLNNNAKVEQSVVLLKEAKQVETPGKKEQTDDKIEQKNQKTKMKKPAKPTAQGIALPAVPGIDETEILNQEGHMQTGEETEASKKAEELRKAEKAAKLKEQKKLENQAKSKEGMERKRIREQKAREKALEKERKEAEKREKDKEKKAKKKEQKKALMDETNSSNDGESAVTPDATEIEMAEKPPATVSKKPQKVSHFTKQSKTKSIPPPLRNRRKKGMQTWMWVAIAVVVAFFVFWLKREKDSRMSQPTK